MQKTFLDVLTTWKPECGKNTNLIQWLISEWCNYSCYYCHQTHDRYSHKGEGVTAHAFDNFPLYSWLDAFRRHFANERLSFVITGGEPLIDKKNMPLLLKSLSDMTNVDSIRIDTNVSWNLDWYKDLDKSKIILMCTYHPSQIKEENFLLKIRNVLDNGFEIGMVNYVLTQDSLNNFFSLKEKFRAFGIPLHPNPLWNSTGKYSPEDMKIFEVELPEQDYLYRTGIMSPNGKNCLFPSIAYEIDYLGNVKVGCHPKASGNIFDSNLPPLFPEPVPCPYSSCACLHKYSFLEGNNRNITTNPLRQYSQALKDLWHPIDT